MWGRDIKASAQGKGKGPATTNEQALIFKTAPLCFEWPNEQEYAIPPVVSQYREHQCSHAHSNRLAGARFPQTAWVVSGGRLRKYAQQQEVVIPDGFRNHTSTREAVVKDYFFIYVVADNSDGKSRDIIPTSGSYTFQFEGNDAEQDLDARIPWTGAVTAIDPEEKAQADFLVLVKKQKGARYLRAFDSLKEAQETHRGYACRLIAKANIRIAERELLAVQQIVRADRPDLENFRKILLHGNCMDLEIIDGTAGRYFAEEDDERIQMEDVASFQNMLFRLQKSNEPQQRAVKMVFGARGGLTLIVGPPGTGKTDTLAVIVFLAVAYGHKALVCAASNDAVNRLFQGLLDLKKKCEAEDHSMVIDWYKFDLIRLNVPEAEFHYAKRPKSLRNLNVGSKDNDEDDNDEDDDDEVNLPFLQMLAEFEDKTWGEYHRLTSPHYAFPEHSLGAAVMRSIDMDLWIFKQKNPGANIEDMAADVQKKADPSHELRKAISKYHNLNDTKMDGKQLQQLRFLYNEQCMRVLRDAFIIATTNNNAGCSLLANFLPDIVIVDEAAQSTEASTLVPTTRWESTKLRVLIGDERQLQPTVTSRGYNEFYPQMFLSLFERLRKLGYQNQVKLTVQYRMCADISDFLIKHIYHGTLQNYPDRTIERPIESYIKSYNKHMAGIPRAFLMLDVPFGRGIVEANSTSFVNRANVEAIADLVYDLLQGKGNARPLLASNIQVLSYYEAQRRALHDAFRTMGTDSHGNKFSNIEVKTVDGSQGSQCDVIIVDTVCTSVQTTNSQHNVVSGFVRSLNRVNVSLSRAMDGLYVVGSLATLKAGRKDKRSTGDILPLLAKYVEDNGLVFSLTRYGEKPSMPGR